MKAERDESRDWPTVEAITEPIIRRTARKYAGTCEIADLEQTARVKLWEQRHALQTAHNRTAFARTVIRNAMLDLIDTERQHAYRRSNLDPAFPVADVVADSVIDSVYVSYLCSHLTARQRVTAVQLMRGYTHREITGNKSGGYFSRMVKQMRQRISIAHVEPAKSDDV